MTNKEISESLKRLIRGNRDALSAYLLEVCSNETIADTKSELHIHMLRLDGNNRPRTNDFANFITDYIVDYCITPSQIHDAKELDKKNNTTVNTVKLYRKAQSLFTDLSNTGEGGELLLSIMVQQLLGMPQLLCKMPLKTNSDVHYHGADGIYGKFDESINKFCLYWGESKIYSDIGQAMTDCFDSIKNFLNEEGAYGTRRERDLTLFRDNLDFNNGNLEEVILSFLDPDKEDYLKMEYRGVCLIGYNEDAYPLDFSAVEEEIKNAVHEKIITFKKMISKRLKDRPPMENIVMNVLLVPFADVDAFRTKFLEAK